MIKFRGKRLDAGEWVYGDVLHAQNYDPNTRTANKSENLIIVTGEVGERSYVADIIPNTLGQFTGLHDKDGREIYEGDILSFRINGKIVKNQVGWIDSIAAFDFVKSKTPSFFNELCAKKSIIIGNIHDNPPKTIQRDRH